MFREKLLILVLLVIRTFSSYDGTQDSIVEECFNSSYSIWMSLFMSALQSSLTIHINMKRYILKVNSNGHSEPDSYLPRYAAVLRQIFTILPVSYLGVLLQNLPSLSLDDSLQLRHQKLREQEDRVEQININTPLPD